MIVKVVLTGGESTLVELSNVQFIQAANGKAALVDGKEIQRIETYKERDGGDGRPRVWGRTSAFLRLR